MDASDPTFIRNVTNHWSHFGPDALIEKSGRKWAIVFSDYHHPALFDTKREARQAVGQWVTGMARSIYADRI